MGLIREDVSQVSVAKIPGNAMNELLIHSVTESIVTIQIRFITVPQYLWTMKEDITVFSGSHMS